MNSTIRRGAAIIALACAPPAAGAAGDGPLRIATLSYPVYLMALNVAGRAPGVEVSYIRLHSASAPAELANSDILVAHGEGIESSLDEIAIRFPGLAIVETAAGIARSGEEDERLPWIWMSAGDAVREVRNLRGALERLDPARRERYALNAERYAALDDGHAVGARPGFGDLADGIGNRADHIDAIGHRVDARLRESQPVHESAAHAASLRLGDVLGIGGQNLIRMGADGGRHGGQRRVLLLTRG